MKYQVKLVGASFGVEDKTILETEDRTEAFEMMGNVKKMEHEEPYNAYDSVRVFENGTWVAKFDLY